MPELKFIKDKSELKVQAPSSGLEYTYPSEFFKDSRKPQLIVPDIYKDLPRAREAFVNSLRLSTPDLDAGKEFAYRMLLEIEEDNSTDWTSFGVQISSAGEKVNVWDLFEVTIKAGAAPSDAQMGGGPTGPDLGILVLFCSIYRMGAITDQGYLRQVSDRIMTQAVGIPNDIPRPDALISLVNGWLTDANYLKMIAGIDMFLNRFPKASFSPSRIGTISSRYRDCASLLSIRFFLHIIGSDDLYAAPAWISYEPIALDLIRMSKVGQEAAVNISYFPYQSDLGMVKKSAYSTVVNPSYFFFVQGVGALLGLERSRNARMNLEYGIPGTVSNIFWVAYVHKRNHIQARNGDPVLVQGEKSDTERDGITIRSNSPVKWAKFLATRDWTLTEFMKDTIRKMQAELIASEPRAGTIGEFLAKHSID